MDVDGFKQYCESQVQRQGGGMTASTASTYIPIVKRFADWYDGVGEPDGEDIREWVRHLEIERQVSNSTIQKYFNAVRKYFYYKQRLGDIEQVAAWVSDQYPKGGSDTPDSFTDEELRELRTESTYDPRTDAEVAILSTIGCRVSELVELRTTDITIFDAEDASLDGELHSEDDFPEWVRGTINVSRNKRMEDVSDKMPLGEYEVGAIQKYLTQRSDYAPSKAATTNWLFPSHTGGKTDHITTETVRGDLNRLADRTSLDRSEVHPHKFRHTVASRLGKQSKSAKQIAEYLGQKNASSAETYTHLDRDSVVSMRQDIES